MISATEKENLVVGYKQVLKALKNKKCIKLFIAEDCSPSIRESLVLEADGVETVYIPTMRELGALCDIDVASSCACIIGL